MTVLQSTNTKNPLLPTIRTNPLVIRSTSPIRQSFPLSSTHFFTGALFDSVVVFLQKYSIEWHDIQCVARGIHPDIAVPTIYISVTSNKDMDEVARMWDEYCHSMVDSSSGVHSLKDIVPNEIMEVEFARVFADLLPAPTTRANGGGAALAGFLGTDMVGGSIVSLVAASLKSAAGRSEVSLVSCTCPPERESGGNVHDEEWSGVGDEAHES